jgi:hypothetical protein
MPTLLLTAWLKQRLFLRALRRMSKLSASELAVIIRSHHLPSLSRQAALAALAESPLSTKEKMDTYVACVEDPDPGVQQWAICAIEADGSGRAAVQMQAIAALPGPNRIYALRALASAGDPSVVELCESLLEHGAMAERVQAVSCLGLMRSEPCQAILRSLFCEALPHDLRRYVALQLASCGDRSSEQFLQRELKRCAPWWPSWSARCWRLQVAVALTLLENVAGMRVVKRVLLTGSPADARILQTLVLREPNFGIDRTEPWRESLLEWLTARGCT